MPLTYAQLKTAVQDYTENTFSDTDFATLTRLAEQLIYNAASIPVSRKSATLSTVIGNPLVNLPTDFLSAFSLAAISALGEYIFLLNKDVNFIREAFPNPATTGTPQYYALNGAPATPLTQTVLLGPTPSAPLSLDLNYFAYPESITVAASGTSWLGQNFESVLFDAVMVEAARFMKQEADIVAMYEQKLQKSLLLFKQLADGKGRRDAFRSGQARMEVS